MPEKEAERDMIFRKTLGFRGVGGLRWLQAISYPLESGLVMQIPLLVSQQWLHDNLTNPEIQVIENAWIRESYHKAHISGAFYLPVHPYLKKINANKERTQQVMEFEDFMALCHVLGLRRDKHYIIYDDYFGLFAARFWCVCRHFGVYNLSILDGSWRGWMGNGYPVSSRLEVPTPGTDIVIDPNTPPFHRIG